jgi:hypothetical protein
VGPEPEAAPIEQMGLGWKSSFKSGKGGDQIGSGLEGSWTPTPTQWDMTYLDMLFGNEWVVEKSPAGAWQWTPKRETDSNMAPAADDASKKVQIIMTAADMAMRMDPIYEPIARRFHKNPEEFADAFARAWFKLTHRDMGPVTRYLGPLVPAEHLLWQDPIPAVNHALNGLGVGRNVPRQRQARWGERSAHLSCAAKGLGGQPAGRTGESSAEAGIDPAEVQRRAVRWEEGLACGPHRSGRLRRRRGSREKGRPRREGSVLARSHGRIASPDRRRLVRRPRTGRRRVP